MPHFIAGTDTWLNSTVYTSEISPSNYQTFRADREDGYGGGVFFACHNTINCTQIKIITDCEAVACKIKLSDSRILIVLVICDRISHNKASTHTKSNLRFYQKWIAGLIHYHIPHCTSFRIGKSGFCGSFLPTLSKPRMGDWCH